MIPYERLCEALDRFNRRGEQPEEATAQAAGAPPPPPSPVPGGDDVAPHEVAAGLTSTADGIAVEPVAEVVPEVTEVPMTEVPVDGAPLMEAPTVTPEEPIDAAAMDAAAVEVAPMEVPPAAPAPVPMDPMAGAAPPESPEVAAYAPAPAAESVQLAPDYGQQSAEALAMHPTAAEIPLEQPSVVIDGGAPPPQPEAPMPALADESTVVSSIPVEEEQKA